MKILSKIKSLFRKGTNTGISFNNALPSSGLDDTFLFDFKNYQSQYTGVAMNSFISVGGASDSDSEESSKETSRKIAVKPKDVLNELETIPTPWTLSNLDDKIEVLKYKADLITQNYSKREVQGLIERLENRKQWHKFKNFFQNNCGPDCKCWTASLAYESPLSGLPCSQSRRPWNARPWLFLGYPCGHSSCIRKLSLPRWPTSR
jgi:hypothetical protein